MTTLVVVDDEPLVTEILKLLLEDAGYTVHVASNGGEALDMIARVRPALVVTDFMMPVMSGLELAIALRKPCGGTEAWGHPVQCHARCDPR